MGPRLLLALALAACVFPSFSLAQDPSSNPLASARRRFGLQPCWLRGSVLASDGTPVPGVAVHAVDERMNSYQAITDDAGRFEFIDLPSGEYTVEVDRGGMNTRASTNGSACGEELNLRVSVQRTPGSSDTVSVREFQVSSKARRAYERAQREFREHHLDDALKHAAEALRGGGGCFGDAAALEAVLLLERAQKQDAVGVLEQAIHCDPANPKPYFVLGSAYNALAKFSDALRASTSGLRLAPRAWQGMLESAKALMGMKSYPEALARLNEAEQLAKDTFPDLHVHKANAYLGIGQWSQAAAELQLYLKKSPDGANAPAVRAALQRIEAGGTR